MKNRNSTLQGMLKPEASKFLRILTLEALETLSFIFIISENWSKNLKCNTFDGTQIRNNIVDKTINLKYAAEASRFNNFKILKSWLKKH